MIKNFNLPEQQLRAIIGLCSWVRKLDIALATIHEDTVEDTTTKKYKKNGKNYPLDIIRGERVVSSQLAMKLKNILAACVL